MRFEAPFVAHLPRLPGFSRPRQQVLIWLLIGVLGGIAAAVLPWQTSLLILALAIVILGGLIDTRIALIATLILGPLKILLETEIPFFQGIPDVGQLALALTLVSWFVGAIVNRSANRRSLGLRWTPMIVPLALFLLAAAFSLWDTFAVLTTLKELLIFAEMLVMVVLVVALTDGSDNNYYRNRNRTITWIVAGLIASGVVQALIGIYEFRGGSGSADLWILDYHYFRAFGSFGQPNPFGAWMGMALALSLGVSYGVAEIAWKHIQAVRTRKSASLRENIVGTPFLASASTMASVSTESTVPGSPSPAVWERGPGGEVNSLLLLLALLAADAILAVGLLVSWSRGAWMGFGAAALILLLFAPRRRWLGALLVILLVSGTVLFFASGLAPASLVARVTDFTQELANYDDVRAAQINDANYAVLERLAHWQAAFGMATDHPWIGVGFGAYELAYPRYELMNWPNALGHAHNFYINLLAETGIIGLTGYLVACVLIVIMTLRVLKNETAFRRGVALGILGVWGHLAVHSLFDKLYVNNLPLHIGVMLGLIGSMMLTEKANPRKREIKRTV